MGYAVETCWMPLITLQGVSRWSSRVVKANKSEQRHTFIFLDLHVEQPVRLFLCARRPILAYPGGCCRGGFGRASSRDAGGVGVSVACWTEEAETGESDGGMRSDIMGGGDRLLLQGLGRGDWLEISGHGLKLV
jgi:hypothetical protein